MESGTVRGNGRQIDFEMAAGGDTGPSEGEKDRVRGHADNERGLARREPRKYMVPTGCRGTRHLTIIQITFGRRGRGRDPFGNRLESRLTILSPSRVPSIRPRFFSRRVEEERSPPFVSRTCSPNSGTWIRQFRQFIGRRLLLDA